MQNGIRHTWTKIEKICMAIIACLVSVFLVSCQRGIEDGVKQEINSTFDLDETIKIEEYLETSVSELADYKQFIENQSSGEAHLLVETSSSLRQIGEKKYYPVYVGEQWSDHRVNWEWFYVSEQMNEILWYNLVDDEFCSLEEWRNSTEYRAVNLMGYSDEDAVPEQNPYFYDTDHIVLGATAEYYELETKKERPIEIEVYLVKAYEKGKLYKFVIEPTGYLDDARTNIYFYVTSEKIYRIWSYIYQGETVTEFYDDDALLTKYLDTDIKLIDNGEIVCQFEEMPEEKESSTKSSILLTENKVIYSRYDVQENGETGFYEWFTWERNKGLVDYGSGFGVEGDILYLKQIYISQEM